MNPQDVELMGARAMHDEFLEHSPLPKPPSPEQSPHRGKDRFIHLELDYATHKIRRPAADGTGTDHDVVKLRSYNGKLPGPLIEARPGDTLNIYLDNLLPHAEAGPGFNHTNLHFHGLHVSPVGNGDNVSINLPPGKRFQYEVKIPFDHPAGTYWYHAHRHGSATLQIANGMAGALIIRGEIDQVPAIKEAKERIIVFQQIPYVETDDPTKPGHKANMVESYDLFKNTVWQQLGRRFTLNGDVEPTFSLCPGEVEFWRLVHAGIRERLRLRLVRREGGQEIPLQQFQIAHDGITTGRIDAVTETEMHPGYRVDMLVRASEADGTPLKPGTYWLVDENVAAPKPGHTLARILVKGGPKHMKLPKVKELEDLAPFKPVKDSEITGTQQAIFSIDTSTTPLRFLVNGKVFDPAHPRVLELGAVEEWTVTSQNFDHPFHIHVNPFQVMTGDGKVLWKDTLMVPSGKTFKLRTRYERYIGEFMLHCHISEHADLGMAELIRIDPPGGLGHGGGGHPPHH
jgi:FtsP/CotA-like multicopper oxidase with cupredoxin domain